jgi:hypothetical protein
MNTMINIRSAELGPGDVLSYGGQRRRITAVLQRPGWSFPVAVDGTGWAIALDDRPLTVMRTVGAQDARLPTSPASTPGIDVAA